MTDAQLDVFGADLVHGDTGGALLRAFNQVGVLAPADVHAANRMARLGGEPDEAVALAVALAVRAPRVGHVSVDLLTVRSVAVAGPEDDEDIGSLPWPDPDEWVRRVARSPLIAVEGADRGATLDTRPLHLSGTSLYLDRYWRDELAVAADLLARAGGPTPEVDEAALGDGLARLLGGPGAADQREAAATAVRRRLTVVAGGPGTGKTTAVARLLALLFEQAAARRARPPLAGLAAPTGKAAARLEEAVRSEAARVEVAAPVAAWLAGLTGSTLHRLLGSRAGSTSRFRHHRGHRLPHDVVVVDEASMVSLALMARLVEAVRPDARLILVGDPEQLVSVEAGAVLADIAGPAIRSSRPAGGGSSSVAAGVAVLRTNHRFSGALAALADAVREGDPDATVAALGRGDPAVVWVPCDPATAPAGALEPLRSGIVGWASEVVDAARRGDSGSALAALAGNRVLCAHRRGPAGAAVWNDRIVRWLGEEGPDQASEGDWYAGRPVLVTANDYSLRLFNGDTGVAVAAAPGTGPVTVAFGAGPGGPVRSVGPSRLPAVETVFAMTIHKSQGSEFDRVTLLLPPSDSRLLTRELFYTAVTRARRAVVVVASEEAVRTAVGRPVSRASGLGALLWQPA